MKRSSNSGVVVILVAAWGVLLSYGLTFAASPEDKEEKRKREIEILQERFQWWPTDATPGPQKDARGGYWWWPTTPGSARPWGNRGYVYVYKIVFDYKADELPPAKPNEPRPSLLIKNIIKNVKIYFDFNKANLREDAAGILTKAVGTLRRNPTASILITGNTDVRGSESYNLKLGRQRAESVKNFMLEHGIPEERIKIVSRGKLDAVAPVTDLVGMQKDRNAQFMIASVEEIMIPHSEALPLEKATPLEEGKYLLEEQEQVESQVQVETRQYTIQKNDSLWGIAQRELGSGHRWKYIYELNKDKIKDPNRLKPGQVIILPVE